MIIDDDKGKPGTIITRTQPWIVPLFAKKLDEIMVFSQQGLPVYNAININNNISLGRLSAGTYYYEVKAKDENGAIRKYQGVLVIMN